MIQTILIPRNKFTLTESKKWIKDHGYKLTYYGKKVHITSLFYRYRQQKPNKKLAYRTITLKNGIEFVIQ